MKGKDNWKQWIPAFIFALLLIVTYKTLDNVSQIGNFITGFLRVIAPFFFGVLIVYFLYVPSKKLEDLYSKSKVGFIKKRKRVFSLISVYLVLIFAIALIITFIIPILIQSILDLVDHVPVYINNILAMIDNVGDGFNIRETLITLSTDGMNELFNPTRVDQFIRGLVSFATSIFHIIISIIVSLYILLEREKIKEFFENLSKTLFKDRTHNRLKQYLKQINQVIFSFIAGKGLDSLINGVVVTGVLLILDVKYAFLLGIIAALANFIPYLGTLVAMIFIGFITLLTGGLSQAIPTTIILLIFQQLDANFIEPRIMKTKLKISPLLVIFAVFVGGAYFGILGMFLAVPIATILKQILLQYIEYRKAKKGTIITKKAN